MASFAAQNSTGDNFSYKELTTFTKIRECITLVCITAKLQISLDEQQRIAKTWQLLMDYRIAFVIAGLARDQYNYHCTDLIEMFTLKLSQTTDTRLQPYTPCPTTSQCTMSHPRQL